MKEEIKRVCEIKEVSHAAMQLCERENKNQIALMVYNQETEEIYIQNQNESKINGQWSCSLTKASPMYLLILLL